MSYTPGPWKIEKKAQFADLGYRLLDGNGQSKILICDDPFCGVYVGKEADAKLIAAAPELLYSAQEIVSLSEEYKYRPDDRLLLKSYVEAHNRLRAAVIKAGGIG